MNWKILVGLFLVLWAGAACTPEAEPASDIVTAVSTRAVAHTAVPTSTQTPTATVTPSSSPTKTTTPTATPTSTLTPTPIPTPEILDSYESPSGEWIATLEEGYFFNEPNSYLFRVVSADGKVEWVVEHSVYDESSLIGFNRRIPIHWSENGENMYFTRRPFGDGCGPFVDHVGLSRIDLQTGQIEELITGGAWVAVAPNDEKAAYLTLDEVVLLDFATMEEVVIELNYDPTIEYINFSDLTWSPDSNSLLVLGAEDVCMTGLLDGRPFITRIDTQSLTQNTILDDPNLRRIWGWPEPDKVLLYVADGNASLNPETGEIIPDEE